MLPSVRTEGPLTVVTTAGELDLSNAGDLRGCLSGALDGGAVRLVIDMSDVTFVDSTILSVLVGTRNRLSQVNGELTVVCDAESVLRVFRMTALDRLFTIRRTLAEVSNDAS